MAFASRAGIRLALFAPPASRWSPNIVTLTAMTATQIPLLDTEIVGQRRYLTPEECAKLQSLDGMMLPDQGLAAYRALGNAVNANVIKAIAEPLVVGLKKPTSARKRRPAA